MSQSSFAKTSVKNSTPLDPNSIRSLSRGIVQSNIDNATADTGPADFTTIIQYIADNLTLLERELTREKRIEVLSVLSTQLEDFPKQSANMLVLTDLEQLSEYTVIVDQLDKRLTALVEKVLANAE